MSYSTIRTLSLLCFCLLFSGSECIPLGCTLEHVIQPGDTCWDLATNNGMTLDQFYVINPDVVCANLQINDRICLSKGPNNSQFPCTAVHVIKAGDTCWDLANKNGMSLTDFYLMNPGIACQNLPINGSLCLNRAVASQISKTVTTVSIASFTTRADAVGSSESSSIGTFPELPTDDAAGILDDNLLASSTELFPELPTDNADGILASVSLSDTLSSDIETPSSTTSNSLPTPNAFNDNLSSASDDGKSTAVCTLNHVIRSGDTCWDLANKNGISLAELFNFNPNIACNFLKVGQIICLGTGSTGPISSCSYVHTIVSGDICWDLANKYGTTVDELRRINPGMVCENLQIGAPFCIQRRPNIPLSPCTSRHIIVSGDTCWDLANRNRMTLDQFRRINPGVMCNNLRIGDTLCLSRNPGIRPINGGNTCGELSISVGYATSWLADRQCMAVKPEEIDASAYTHIHYSFAYISENFQLQVNGSDIYLRNLIRHVNSNYPGVKIVISVGGWTHNDPDMPTTFRFSDMVSSFVNRRTFIQSAKTFMQTYGANGIDIDWEYPSDRTRGGRVEDADNLVLLMQEMRSEFNQQYSTSIAIPSGISSTLAGFKINQIVPFVDYIVSMSYDFGISSNQLYGHTNMTDISRSISETINIGVPANKLLLGLAFYGRSYKQADRNCSDIGCPKSQEQAIGGRCSKEPGQLTYREISEIVSQPANVRLNRFDDNSLINVLAYGDDQWITYDSPDSIRKKMDYAKKMCLAGTSVWSIDIDDANRSLSKAILGVLSS